MKKVSESVSQYSSHPALGHLLYFKTDPKTGCDYAVGEVDNMHIQHQILPYKSIASHRQGANDRWAFEFRLSSRLVWRKPANGTADQLMLALLDRQHPFKKDGSLNITGIAYNKGARGHDQIQEELRSHQNASARRDPKAYVTPVL